ncbi:taperin isoform X2 [Heptranchias perlo]|uniref:taperin isoform X2 n=1 Tax=Heptranchias perlo TaxID=212740 RepID=UPI003559CFA4
MSVSEQRPPPPPQPQVQEPGPDGHSARMARMPAWKREILERRKAKLASPVVATADGRSWNRNRAASHSNRAGEASRGQSPSRGAVVDGGEGPQSVAGPGGAVLLESIAPIQENPFIKRERRRRRLVERESPGGGGSGSGSSSARPVQQLLDLYSHIPGVRTIRADNIIIIESDPDYFTEAGPRNGGLPRINSVGDLLSRGGKGSVAEIRASEVLIYEGPLSRSEENLSTLGTEETSPGHLQGKVSRLLEKFDHNYVKPARSRSTENLLDGFSPSRDREQDRHSKPLLLPKPLTLNKHSQGPASKSPPHGQPRPGVSPFPEGGRSPGPHLDDVSPSHSKSFPLFSPTRYSAPLPPGRTSSSVPRVALHDQGTTKLGASDKTVPEDTPCSVSSYRKQFENVPADGRQLKQKESTPSHKGNDNILKVWATKENKLMENGHPELDLMGSDVFSVKADKMDNDDQVDANVIGSGRVPSPLGASSNEVSKGPNTWRPKYEVDLRKTSKSSPETPQPTAIDGSRSSPAAKPSATPLGKVKQNHKVEGLAKVTPNQCNGVSASTSLNDSFQIVPAAPPDISSIPEDDMQARALANLRKQSKNSFVVIPKRRAGAFVASSNVCDDREMNDKTHEKPKLENGAATSVEVQTSRISTVSPERISPSDHRQSKEGKLPVAEPPLPKADFKLKEEETLNKTTSRGSYDVSHMSSQLSFGEGMTGLLPTETTEAERDAEATVILINYRIEDDIPVTNIDDILVTEEKEIPTQPIRAKSAVTKDKPPEESFGSLQHPFVQRKSGNTFTIVPHRKPASSGQAPSVNAKEISQANGTDELSVEDPEPSLAKLGVLLKKRYPPAEEIQVIGGYLSLERSCLSKGGSTRKKMKISFNDSSLHTTFEYPSESSLVQEGDSEESDNDEEEQSSTFFIPRPSYTSSPTSSSSPLRTNTLVSALSNYTPKHAMPFNSWQEQKLDETLSSRNSALQDTESTTEDGMLTPADSSSHSDYSSEPALYF